VGFKLILLSMSDEDKKWVSTSVEDLKCVVFDFDHTLCCGHLFWFTLWTTGYGYDGNSETLDSCLENAVRFLRHQFPEDSQKHYATVFKDVRDWCKANGQMNPDNAAMKKQGGPLPKDPAEVDEKEKQAIMVALFGGEQRIKDLKKFLSDLIERKIKLVISSKGVRAVMLKCLERLDMVKPFDFVFGFDWLKGTKSGKPGKIVEKMPHWGLDSCKPRTILFVDDDFKTETKFAVRHNLPFYSKFGMNGLQKRDFEIILEAAIFSQENVDNAVPVTATTNSTTESKSSTC